jgi:hypothetical protein
MKTPKFIDLFSKTSIIVVIIFSLLQIIFFSSFENISCVFIVVSCWLISSLYILKFTLYTDFPFSSTVILGFSLTQFALPVIFTLLEGKPLVYNLMYPIDILVHSALALFVLIIVHSFYVQKQLNTLFSNKIKWQKYLKSLDFFTLPSEKQLWLMGLVGQLATSLNVLTRTIGSTADASVGLKFIQGFIIFAAAPYFLAMKKLYGDESNSPIKYLSLKLSLYTLLQIVTAMIVNSRAAFISSLTGLGICYLVGLLINKYDFRKITISRLLIFLTVIYIITAPITDISIAMLVVRRERADLSAQELISQTLEVYNNKDAIKNMKVVIDQDINKEVYSEKYLNSIFLSRFCNLKFNDNAFISYYKIGGIDDELVKYTYNRFLVIFPDPVLKYFGVSLNKKDFISTSYGDYIFFRAGGEFALGGLRVGHFAGTGMATLGWYYLLFLGVFTYPLFFLFDLFVLKINSINKNTYILSLAGLSSIITAFLFYTNSTSSESVTTIVNFLIREWIQIVVLYLLIFKLTKFL